MSAYDLAGVSIPRVVFCINLEHRILDEYAQNTAGLRKIYGRLQRRVMKSYEYNLSTMVDGCIYNSALEEGMVRAWNPALVSVSGQGTTGSKRLGSTP